MVNIIGSRKLKRSKFQLRTRKILGAAFDKLVAQAVWPPGLIQPCAALYFFQPCNKMLVGAIVSPEFYVHGSVHRESISITVQQDATLYGFYSLRTALHVSGDIFTHHQERE
jgi:hypothetical protein